MGLNVKATGAEPEPWRSVTLGAGEEVWSDALSKWSVLRAVSPRGPTVRGALKAAGIETRREEATRNRLQNNQRRAHPTPQH